jgi:hypothetical protein
MSFPTPGNEYVIRDGLTSLGRISGLSIVSKHLSCGKLLAKDRTTEVRFAPELILHLNTEIHTTSKAPRASYSTISPGL